MQIGRQAARERWSRGSSSPPHPARVDAAVATPPPGATFQPPEYTWDQPVFPQIAGGRLADVAGDERGFVAVGSILDAQGVVQRGLVMVSRDGLDWRIADVPGLEQVDVLDVAVGPDGFVIVGERSPGPLLRFAALAVSIDGVAWETPELPDPNQLAYTFRIDRADDRFVVIGTDLSLAGGAFELTSADGRTWSSTPQPYQRRVVPTGAGWLGIGPMTTWTTLDGAPFEADAVPPDDRGRPAHEAETALAFPSGTLLVGAVERAMRSALVRVRPGECRLVVRGRKGLGRRSPRPAGLAVPLPGGRHVR